MQIRKFFILIAVVFYLCGAASAVQPPGPPNVTSLFVPLEGDVTLSNGDLVHFAGEIHVLTQVRFSDTGVPTVNIFTNLNRVEGTSLTESTYILVGATSLEVVGVQPGPPDIPEQTFNFSLISIGTQPGPPNVPPNPVLPVILRNFVFAQEAGFEGNLDSVEASF